MANAQRSTLNGSNLCGCHAGLAASLAMLLRRSAGHAVRCVVASLGLVLVWLRSFEVLMKRYNSAEHTQNVNGLFGNVKLILFFVRRCPVAWASGACWCWVWCWFVRWRCPALSGAGCWFSGGATVCAGVASSNVGQRGGCFFWWFGVFGQYWRYRGRGGGLVWWRVRLVLVALTEQVGCGPSGGCNVFFLRP